MSDAELYHKLKGGMRVAELEIVEAIRDRSGLTNFESLVGGLLFNAGVVELRRLMSDFLISRGSEGAVASLIKAGAGVDVEELRMFIDEPSESDLYTPGDAVHGDTGSPKAKK